MQFLSIALIIDQHKKLIAQFGGLHGIRDKGLLESALAYPQLLYDIGMERDIYILAAAYFYHIIKNHPFIDGNKRTGTLALLIFLRTNEISIKVDKNTLYDLAIKTAQSKIDEQGIVATLKRNTI